MTNIMRSEFLNGVRLNRVAIHQYQQCGGAPIASEVVAALGGGICDEHHILRCKETILGEKTSRAARQASTRNRKKRNKTMGFIHPATTAKPKKI
jgi:hypothetical protein